MKNKTRLKIRLFGKVVTFSLLSILVTPAAYNLTAIAMQVTYIYFWTVLLSVGGGYAIKRLIQSMLTDYKKVRRSRK